MLANAGKGKGLLFLIDDGWRYEKREILDYLNDRLAFDVATHDDLTAEMLRDDFTVTKLDLFKLRGPLYWLAMFFARDLDTNIVKRVQKMRLHTLSPPLKAAHALRRVAGLLGLRRHTCAQTLRFLYRRSRMYDEILAGHHTLLYVPVAVMDKRIVFEARNAGLRVVCWIYSWDNPMKDNEFLPDADVYLVWNEGTVRDLSEFHGVPREKTRIVGPAQFDYLLDRNPVPKRDHEPYVLYACAMGKASHIEQEVCIILNLRRLLDEVRPNVRLLVRPYPFRKNPEQDMYAPLRRREGIRILDFGEVREGRILITREDEEARFVQIAEAECLVNLGSTISLEASFTETPIIQLAFSYTDNYPKWLDIREVLRHEHLKYILDFSFPNSVSCERELRTALEEILSGQKEKYRAYTRKLRKFADPLGVCSYKQVLCDTLRAL